MTRPLLPISNAQAEHFVLHYNPNRSSFSDNSASLAEQNFPAFAGILFGSMALLGLAACLCLSINPIPYLAVVLALGLVLLSIDMTRPTNLELTPDGFRILWLHPLFFYTGPWLDYRAIAHVTICQPEGKPASERFFEVTIDTSTLPRHSDFDLMCIPITSSFKKNQITIRLLESGFFQAADRTTFLTTMRKRVAPECQSPDLVALDTFGDVPSYTALWLNDLQSRDKNETKCLPNKTLLANGGYEIIERLGSGGQSVVYSAMQKDAQSGQLTPCVLKEFVLPTHGGHEIKKRALGNIQREHALLQSFNHPNIVKSLDLFTEGSRAYLVMERIYGSSLRQLVDEGKIADEKTIVSLAVQMCALLEYLHGCEPPVVHRDFTPENLLLAQDNQVKLIDFNVAHRLESASTKTVAGKHAYISPEQFRGKPTVQSDIYSFGASLYFMLMKKDPEPISKSVPASSDALAQIVAACTQPSEALRYTSISQARNDLMALDLITLVI